MENVNAIIGCRKFPNFRFSFSSCGLFLNVLRFYKSKQIDVHVSSKLKSYLEKLYHVFGVKNDNFENNQIIYSELTLFSIEHLILPTKIFTTKTK